VRGKGTLDDYFESNRFVLSVVPVSTTLTPSSNGGQPVLVAQAYCENMCLAMTVDKKIQLDYCNATTATGLVDGDGRLEG